MNSNWSYSPETKIWVVTSVTLTFDLWPWHFVWTLPWSKVITPGNFMMIRWWEHSQKGVTDGQTDGQTDRRTENTIHRAAWSQLKIRGIYIATIIDSCYYNDRSRRYGESLPRSPPSGDTAIKTVTPISRDQKKRDRWHQMKISDSYSRLMKFATIPLILRRFMQFDNVDSCSFVHPIHTATLHWTQAWCCMIICGW